MTTTIPSHRAIIRPIIPTSKPNEPSARSPESYESLRRRNEAAEILRSYEKLSWYSFHRCESLVQTRLHFRNIIAGFGPDEEASVADWKEDFTPRPRPEVRGKGKGRVSGVGASNSPGTGGKGKHRESTNGGDVTMAESSEAGSARKKRSAGERS